MELYQLGYFVELARCRNFTRAAERLRLAQPALSQQMRNLEKELGTILFVRGRRETTLTSAGEGFLPQAEALLAMAEQARQSVAGGNALRAGRLVIATIPTLSAVLLPSVIGRFRKNHPGIDLVLREESSETVAELVERGTVELGFLQLPASPERFVIRELVRERFEVLLPARHALAGHPTVRLSQLSVEPFIFYKGKARGVVLEACRDAGFEPRVACETGELETVRALVQAVLGVAVLPQLAVRALPKGVVSRPLIRPKLERRVGLISRQNHTWSAAAKAFVSTLQDRPAN